MSNQEKRDNFGVHLSHCNFGEESGVCKYGDADCPALTEDWNWFGAALDRNECADRIEELMNQMRELCERLEAANTIWYRHTHRKVKS